MNPLSYFLIVVFVIVLSYGVGFMIGRIVREIAKDENEKKHRIGDICTSELIEGHTKRFVIVKVHSDDMYTAKRLDNGNLFPVAGWELTIVGHTPELIAEIFNERQ